MEGILHSHTTGLPPCSFNVKSEGIYLCFHAPGLLLSSGLLPAQQVHLCKQGSLGSSLGSLQLSNLAGIIRRASRLHTECSCSMRDQWVLAATAWLFMFAAAAHCKAYPDSRWHDIRRRHAWFHSALAES